MEDQCSPLSWAFYYQEEGLEELKHSLLYTTLELETTILAAHEELGRKDEELRHLKEVLAKAVKEREEADAKCQRLMLDKLFLQQQHQAEATANNNSDDEPRIGDSNNGNISSSSEKCDESFTTSPIPVQEVAETFVPTKPLPENGKFLQAVMEAGPLLQTLLLAGPLPQWQHPPPQLNSFEIPPVTIPSPKPQASVKVDVSPSIKKLFTNQH